MCVLSTVLQLQTQMTLLVKSCIICKNTSKSDATSEKYNFIQLIIFLKMRKQIVSYEVNILQREANKLNEQIAKFGKLKEIIDHKRQILYYDSLYDTSNLCYVIKQQEMSFEEISTHMKYLTHRKTLECYFLQVIQTDERENIERRELQKYDVWDFSQMLTIRKKKLIYILITEHTHK